jgi:hypothetical protein
VLTANTVPLTQLPPASVAAYRVLPDKVKLHCGQRIVLSGIECAGRILIAARAMDPVETARYGVALLLILLADARPLRPAQALGHGVGGGEGLGPGGTGEGRRDQQRDGEGVEPSRDSHKGSDGKFGGDWLQMSEGLRRDVHRCLQFAFVLKEPKEPNAPPSTFLECSDASGRGFLT